MMIDQVVRFEKSELNKKNKTKISKNGKISQTINKMNK